jgi:hypothetical protein
VHKGTGQVYVYQLGRRVYLGRHDKPETIRAYHQLMAEWAINGGVAPAQEECVLVKELIARFWIQFLLGLGFALRLIDWERQGLFPHLQMGLPTALDAIRQVIEDCTSQPPKKRDELVMNFSRRVFEISCTRLAWQGQSLLGADILVGHPDEEALLDALAELAWQNRKKV